MGKVSIIITSYNQKALLREAMESVLNQTYRPIEIIVCDDASQDGSQELISRYEKNHPGVVKGILHPGNLGISRNRNSGLQAARGELVSWLDGDDTYHAGKIKREVAKYRSDPEIKWVYSQVIQHDCRKNISHPRYHKVTEGRILKNVIRMIGCAPRNPLVELNSLKQTGFFDDSLEMYEDFDLCLRLAKNYKCGYCPEPGLHYRIHSGGIHSSSIHKHIFSLQKLSKKMDDFIDADFPETAKAIRTQLYFYQNYLQLKQMIDNGRLLEASSYFFKMIKLKPVSGETYLKGAKSLASVIFQNHSRKRTTGDIGNV